MRLIKWIKFLYTSSKFAKNIRVNYAIDSLKDYRTRHMCVALRNSALIRPEELKGFTQENFSRFIEIYYPSLVKYLTFHHPEWTGFQNNTTIPWITTHNSDVMKAKVKFLELFC